MRVQFSVRPEHVEACPELAEGDERSHLCTSTSLS